VTGVTHWNVCTHVRCHCHHIPLHSLLVVTSYMYLAVYRCLGQHGSKLHPPFIVAAVNTGGVFLCFDVCSAAVICNACAAHCAALQMIRATLVA
jgi:hypothetical protein